MGGMDMLRWMMCRMGECKIGMGASSVYQPYIMALILSKVRDFKGALERAHKEYRPSYREHIYH